MRNSEKIIELQNRIQKLEDLLFIDDEFSQKRNFTTEISGKRFIECVEETPLVERIWELEQKLMEDKL